MTARDWAFQPITSSDPYTWDAWAAEKDYDDAYNETDHKAIENLLLGKSVKNVGDDHLLLSDGTVLRLIGNEGCGGCPSGEYELDELNGTDNIITAVEFDDSPAGDDTPCRTCGSTWCHENGHDNSTEGHYRIFVLAEDKRINLATFTGSDGNGYYGTGYHILVRHPRSGEPR